MSVLIPSSYFIVFFLFFPVGLKETVNSALRDRRNPSEDAPAAGNYPGFIA